MRESLDDANSEAEVLEERIETARRSMPSSPDTATDRLQEVVSSYSDVLGLIGDLRSPEELAGLAAASRETSRAFEQHRETLQRLPDSLPDVGEAEVGAARRDVDLLIAERDAAKAAERQSQEAVEVARENLDAIENLAAAALPLLPQDTESAPCPVCKTVIDPRRVSAALRASSAGGAALAAAEKRAASARVAAKEAIAAASDAEQRLEALLAQIRERARVLETLSRTIRSLDSLVDAPPSSALVIERDGSLLDAAPQLSSDAGQDLGDDLFNTWMELHQSSTNRLGRIAGALTDVAKAADALSSAHTAAHLATERAASLPRQEAQLEEVRQQIASIDLEYESARRDETAAASLAQQATAATTEIFRDRFAALEPLMNDIYARLDPHPAFTHLDFKVETYRAKGTAVARVEDRQELIEANPMLVFSSAQANAVVIAAFLALSWAARESGLPFVLLDDPLQAFDDVNVLGFADVARRFRRQRQLVAATHEERFAVLLERKLTGRTEDEDLLVHQFTGWSRSGPSIESRRISPEPMLELAVLAS